MGQGVPMVAQCLSAHGSMRMDPTTDTFVPVQVKTLNSGTGNSTGQDTFVPLAWHGRQDPGPGNPWTHALDTDGGSVAVWAGTRLRRLTPREWERCQGFPDDFTAIEHRGRPATDSVRYSAIGNSMAVPVLRWIGEQMQLVDELNELL